MYSKQNNKNSPDLPQLFTLKKKFFPFSNTPDVTDCVTAILRFVI